MASSTCNNLRAAYAVPATPSRVHKIDMNRLLLAPKAEYMPRRRIDFDSDGDRHDEVPSIME
uniref:Uncharacterized protein n=1 Tax=Panagrellus redivivus TaxID=6233 RepID=A0A7E4W364_PANRE